ncbi:MAG: Wzy polymerase domain-containing protein [Betaproteobacteria bacterium]
MPRVAAAAWLVAALLSSCIALLQYFGVSGTFSPWINVAPLGEAFGNLRQRNQFATLTNMGLAVLMFASWRFQHGSSNTHGGPQAQARPIRAVALAAAVALLAIANAATLSRTGLVQLLMLGLLALVWRPQTPAQTGRLLGLALLVYVLASLLLPSLIGRDPFDNGIGSRFRSPGMPCEGRWLLWRNVVQLILQKPWSGWGWGEVSYAHFITPYPGGRFCDILDNAHNLPLHLAVVWGIPAALLICALVAFVVLRARPWRETVPPRQLAWAVLALIGVHSMLEYPLWYGPFQIAALLALWMLWRTRHLAVKVTPVDEAQAQANPPPHRQDTTTALMLGCTAIALAGLAYAAWDYHRVSQIYKAPSLRSSGYRDDTLRKVQGSWLFRNQVRFAVLTLTTVTPENAQSLNAMARQLLHFSPEARVVEKLIDSDLMLGRLDDARYYMLRYRRAFPIAYARWAQGNSHAVPLPELPPVVEP